MTMHGDGLTKLMEECGELTQIAAKKLSFMHTDTHPDGKGSMSKRLEEEIGDVIAASVLVAENLGLNNQAIEDRIIMKLDLFRKWHNHKS